MLKFIPLANLTVIIVELFLLLIPNSSIFVLFGFSKKKNIYTQIFKPAFLLFANGFSQSNLLVISNKSRT
jgi:hypothetical protein